VRAIVLVGRGQQQIDEAASSLQAEVPRVHLLAIAADVSSESQVDRVFQAAIEAFGGIDVLVHCAGVLGPITNVGTAAVDDWWGAFVRGPDRARCCKIRADFSSFLSIRKSMQRGSFLLPDRWRNCPAVMR
jgi:NAD(P)-dependent dehydrogenase (short-subunit alcohol dehydrogenase family)